MGAHSYSIPCTTSAEARTVWGLDLNLVVVWWWNSNQMRKGKIGKLHHQNGTVYEEVYGGVGRHAHWTPPRCTVQCISGLSLNLLSFQLYTQTFMWVSLLSFQYSCAIRISPIRSARDFFPFFSWLQRRKKITFWRQSLRTSKIGVSYTRREFHRRIFERDGPKKEKEKISASNEFQWINSASWNNFVGGTAAYCIILAAPDSESQPSQRGISRFVLIFLG